MFSLLGSRGTASYTGTSSTLTASDLNTPRSVRSEYDDQLIRKNYRQETLLDLRCKKFDVAQRVACKNILFQKRDVKQKTKHLQDRTGSIGRFAIPTLLQQEQSHRSKAAEKVKDFIRNEHPLESSERDVSVDCEGGIYSASDLNKHTSESDALAASTKFDDGSIGRYIYTAKNITLPQIKQKGPE